jgi:predicted dehydrogenase/threonine dehydrogenase-like Zn-dependent dehydrogenase
MRQILQDMGNGATYLVDAPTPVAGSGNVLIETTLSLISAGTERMLVDFGRASLLQKVRQQPERVKMVLDKARTDGIVNTIDAVRSKLKQPIPLGYCNVGVVKAVGSAVKGFKPGDRIASNGPHADIASVAQNLCARIPDGVNDDSAAFTVVASIGLQGIRLAAPTLGEYFVVSGAGLIGLLTVQLLRAHGCKVLAIDLDAEKLALAAQFGAETCNLAAGDDPIAACLGFSHGRGADGIIITASTASNDPVTQAARMCRQRGRIVLVGVVGLELNRADFYAKELSFQVSCAYGAGRYDDAYEKGADYPFGLVRWTAQRNFEAILDMMAVGQIDVKPLISHRIPFDEAPKAYDLLSSDKSALGLLLEYGKAGKPASFERTLVLDSAHRADAARPVVGFIGAGNYASRVLIPAFRAAKAQLKTIVTASGTSGVIHGKAAGFAEASTHVDAMLADASINTVAIVTRHDSHAAMVKRSLQAGKHVFVEKPLALTTDEVDELQQVYAGTSGPLLMVGFNRRFAPHTQKMKQLLDTVREPKMFVAMMNAGAIPPSHWTQVTSVGGGRIIGEACHMIDLLRYFAGSAIMSVSARRMGNNPAVAITEDKATITLEFADGSVGTVHYFANGSTGFPKERIEAFCAGRILALDNFRQLRGYGWSGFKSMKSWTQDKGQNACAAAFLKAIEDGKPAPIASDEIFEVSRKTIEAANLLREQT